MNRFLAIGLVTYFAAMLFGCRAVDSADLAEGTYFIDRQSDRPLQGRDKLVIKKLDQDRVSFQFQVTGPTRAGYVTATDGMNGIATLDGKSFLYDAGLVSDVKGVKHPCLWTFSPTKSEIILDISERCQSWHTPNGKWIRIN